MQVRYQAAPRSDLSSFFVRSARPGKRRAREVSPPHNDTPSGRCLGPASQARYVTWGPPLRRAQAPLLTAGPPPCRSSRICRSPPIRPRPICRPAIHRRAPSPPQQLQHLLELHPHLTHDLLRLAHVRARFLAGELVARARDREALLVEEAPDLPDDDHVLPLVVAPVAAPLDGLQLRKFLLPVAQHVRLDAAELAHLADREVALAGDRREGVVILWFQHRPRPVL